MPNLTNRPVTPKGQKRTKTSKSERESPWYQYGTDKQYQAWCRKQPSAYSGKTGNTWVEHTIQHQVGQYNFMPKWWWEIEVREHLEAWVKDILK